MKPILLHLLLLTCACFVACTNNAERSNEKQAPAMVYEGMPSTELRKIIGEPDSTRGGFTIYDVEASRQKPMERWYYPRRTVVLIDDTVKVPNER